MKLDIPDEKIAKFLIGELFPSGLLGEIMGSKNEVKNVIVKEILENYKEEIVWPKISSKDIKRAVLDKLTEQAIDKIND